MGGLRTVSLAPSALFWYILTMRNERITGSAGGICPDAAMRRQSGFTTLDAVITLCIIGLCTGVFITKYRSVEFAAKSVALKSELANIRSSIRFFRLMNNRPPANLRELLEKRAMLPGRVGTDTASGPVFLNENYLQHEATDDKGNLVDPFGNTFIYDPARGVVKTSTKEFESC